MKKDPPFLVVPGNDPGTKRPPATAAAPGPDSPPPDDWTPATPTTKEMGLVRLTLGRGVKTTAIGQLSGLDFEIAGKAFMVRVYFDYYNRCLEILDCEARDYGAMSRHLAWLARASDFDKVFLKAPREDWRTFLGLESRLEGILKCSFRGDDAYILSRFTTQKRIVSARLIDESEIIENLMRENGRADFPPLPDGYRLSRPGRRTSRVSSRCTVGSSGPTPAPSRLPTTPSRPCGGTSSTARSSRRAARWSARPAPRLTTSLPTRN